MKDIILGLLIGLIIGVGGITFALTTHDSKAIANAVRTGRLSTSQGNFYLIPVPTYAEYTQMQLDLKAMAVIKNKRGKR